MAFAIHKVNRKRKTSLKLWWCGFSMENALQSNKSMSAKWCDEKCIPLKLLNKFRVWKLIHTRKTTQNIQKMKIKNEILLWELNHLTIFHQEPLHNLHYFVVLCTQNTHWTMRRLRIEVWVKLLFKDRHMAFGIWMSLIWTLHQPAHPKKKPPKCISCVTCAP